MSIKKDILFRVGVVYFLMLAAASGVVGRAVYIQITQGAELKKQMAKISLKDIIIEPNRGDILAADGRLLATSLPSYEIRMDTRAAGLTDKIFNDSIDALCQNLSQLPGKKSAAMYRQEIVTARKQNKRYHLIDRRVDFNDLKAIKKYPIFRMGPNKGGLITVQENIRVQPNGGLAARTIGYLTKDPNGNFPGLEGAFDTHLRGERGVGVMQKLSGGAMMPVSNANSAEPKDGGDVVSTIDINIQDVAETSLRRRLQHHNAHHGTAVVMEVATGEIKAIVNLGRNEYGNYTEQYNYALGESIEPGSTFKLMTYMAALEDGKLQPTDSINNGYSGEVRYYSKRVHDDKRPETMGWLTVEEAFAHSSNISTTKFIDKHYKSNPKQFVDRLYSMNLNQKLGLELSGEGEPEIRYPGNKYWSGISLTQMAYGYELRLAPIHTLTFYNAVANNGKMVKPRFVKRLTRHGATEQSRDEVQVIKSSIASAATIRKVKKMMEAVVEYGTAKRIKPELYSIAGKSGTAQVANDKYGYRGDRKYYASFAGYFPADRPKYSCIVSIYAPTVNGYGGGTVSAPVFRDIADKIYAADPDMHETLKPEKRNLMADVPYSKSGNFGNLDYVLDELDIPMENKEKADWVTASSSDAGVELKKRTVEKNLVPNVVDMGLKDALYLLEERGLRVSVRGRGRVIAQSIAPGNRVMPNGSITLRMSQ